MSANTYNPNAADVFPDFAISLELANERIKKFQQYVRENMTEGEDYGVIPGSTKPTLFKPGAEKLNAIFGYAPTVQVVDRFEDWDKFVKYDVKVILINKRTGEIEAEGVGSCNSGERKYARQPAASVANTVLKMAKKRALVDATLSATRASGLFAQDLEDLPASAREAVPEYTPRAAAPANQAKPESNQVNTPDLVTDAPRPTAPRAAARGAAAPRPTTLQPSAPVGEPIPIPHPSQDIDRMDIISGKQVRAILNIAEKKLGRPATQHDLAPFISKPLEDISKPDASRLMKTLMELPSVAPAGNRNQLSSAKAEPRNAARRPRNTDHEAYGNRA